MSENNEHAPFSPSSSSRWLNCPGSYFLSQFAFEEPGSKEASKGSDEHDWIKRILGCSTYETALHELKQVDSLLYEDLVRYKDWIFELQQNFVSLSDKSQVPLVKEFIEEKVYVDKECWGTVDYALAGLRNGKLEIVVVDYKGGVGVNVEAKDNSQLIIYGLGIASKFDVPVHKLRLYVYQPRHHSNVDIVSKAVLNTEELKDWSDKILISKELAKSINQSNCRDWLTVGSWCQFCPAKGICPARIENVNNSNAILEQADNAVQIIPLNQLVAIYKKGDEIKSTIKAVGEYLHNYANNGNTAELEALGLKLVETKGKRGWNAHEADIAFTLEEAGMPCNLIYKKSLVGITEASKYVDKSVIDSLVSTPPVYRKLVPIEDKRETQKSEVEKLIGVIDI